MESAEQVEAGGWTELAARIDAELALSLRLVAKLARRRVRAGGERELMPALMTIDASRNPRARDGAA